MAFSQFCLFLLLGVLMPQHPAGYQHCSDPGHLAQSYPGTFTRVAAAMVWQSVRLWDQEVVARFRRTPWVCCQQHIIYIYIHITMYIWLGLIGSLCAKTTWLQFSFGKLPGHLSSRCITSATVWWGSTCRSTKFSGIFWDFLGTLWALKWDVVKVWLGGKSWFIALLPF